jgi:ATP-dependent helicase YprA (DUF1998 family)
MNPIQLSTQLQNTLVNYLTTTFDVNRDRQEPALAAFIRQSFTRPRALFAGPYLELTPPYKTGETLEELVAEGVLSSRLLQMDCFKEGRPLPTDAPLYTHQAAALRKLCSEDRNIVVSSGTGSGKTECFLIPVLNDLLVDSSSGVRAVLVYPLNALVNDQLDRLRVLLRGTDITFGRYTSELEQNADHARKQMEKEWKEMEPSRKALFDQYPLPNEIIGRDQIQKQGMLPQILITNYAMLEYLLLRPQDKPLFAQGKWRFVVLDEAHTYAGAQGIEVGLLMRRLKLRLGHQPGQMRCIATSATLTDDDAGDACRFAEALFGEVFTQDDIIFGEPDHDYVPPAEPHQPPVEAYIHERFDELIRNVRQEQWESVDEMALLMQEIGLIDNDKLSLADNYDPPQFLWEVLRGNADLTRLRNFMAEKGQPVEVTAVSERLFHDRLPTAQQPGALYHLIELAAMARPAADKSSLLPARYHLFVRPPQGVWACLNPTCPDRQADNLWSKLFATPRETCDACQSPVFPLVVCRTCGQVYVRLQKVGKQFLPEAAIQDEAQTHYVTWRSIHQNRALADLGTEDDEDTLIDQAGESVLKQTELILCLVCQQEVKASGNCGCSGKSGRSVKLYLLQNERPVKKGKSSGTTVELVEHMNECGRCHSRALKGTEIATDITMNALTPLAVLTDELYRALSESPNPDIQSKPGNGRKLLSFYDSRQGAARFAAFVQDVVNQQAYRRIIREAVTSASTETHWPDLERIAEICLELALAYRVAHNDLDIGQGDLPRNSQYLNQNQRGRIVRHMRKQILAEITTQLRSRQSLESLGLMSVQYFEVDRIPDFGDLAEKLNLSEVETRTLIEYLLDDLRRSKVVTLPEGVLRDDPIFGRNKFSPRLVRQDAREYEIAWIGKTPRHQRRQLIGKILRYKKLRDDEPTITQALNDILNWLIDRSHILDTSRPADGYQVRHDSLFFLADTQWYRCDQCQRLNNRGDALPCPHAHCQGTLRLIEIRQLEGDNFYYDKLRQTLIPMRVEEHTAQLDPEKGRDYQNQFKSGNINMLSCSTTFEMGIDLGDLQAVVMSNIPPTVANYKQRAGRSGRRASGTAFILAWASNRPHDQTYFKSPAEIISGRVRVPFIDVQNPIIIQRHVNAVLLSEFLRYCEKQSGYSKNVGFFFDEQTPDGAYYSLLSYWMTAEYDYLLDLLGKYTAVVKNAVDPSHALESFAHELRQKGYDHYQTVAGYYKEVRQRLAQELSSLIVAGSSQRDEDSLSKEIGRYRRLLDRLQGEDTINYLSDRGVLPSYSFPLHVVELRIPPHLLPDNQLRLQRNLQLAIREYAPGQEVVADKRIWKSEALDFFGKEPQIFAYHICTNCNHLRLVDTPGKALDHSDQPCPVCHTAPKRGKTEHQYIQPDGFRASNDSGQPAGQYVDRPVNLMRSALVLGSVEAVSVSQVLAVGYNRTGALLYVNEGFQGNGFRICPKCGKHVSKRTTKCDGNLNGHPCPGKLEKNAEYMLGFKQETDTLHLKFTSTPHILLPEPDNMSFWLSLKYAFLHGASRALQIERKDIDGVLFPEPSGQNWRQSIVLYDNVPGGAGHVKRIQDEIAQVIAAALEIVDCSCEKSCYRCLQEYANQWEHHLLDREPVAEFLRALDADLQQESQGNSVGFHPVAAINPTVWFWEYLQHVQQELIVFADQVTLHSPTAEGLTWLDLLQQLLQRGVKVRLCLNHLPDQVSGSGEAIVIATHLRLLLRKGLDLRQTNRQLLWVAVSDPGKATTSAIRATDGKTIELGGEISTQLSMTNHSDAVVDIWQSMMQYQGRTVEYADLREPADTYVHEIKPDGKKHDESEYFSDFYSNPVRGMVVSDRYLDTRERILGRLGAHIELAQKNKVLEWVLVKTRQSNEEQKQAIQQLKSHFPHVSVKFELERQIAHDRYIEVTRVDGSNARVIIGVGLDFIGPDGNVRNTFLIFQNSYV